MTNKTKALLFNFIGFAIFFLGIRLLLGFYLDISTIFLAVISAILASILAPKFGVVKKEGEAKIFMKWLFLKGFREL